MSVAIECFASKGQERFGNMTRVYYKEAVGAFIVFDVTRQSTFESVAKWKQDLDAKVQLPDGSPIPCVLLANKVSLHSIFCCLKLCRSGDPYRFASTCAITDSGRAFRNLMLRRVPGNKLTVSSFSFFFPVSVDLATRWGLFGRN